MVMAQTQSQIVTHPETVAGAQAAAYAINQAGGIGGHPIVISSCNIGDSSTTEAACARTAVANKITAVVGSTFVFNTAVPILEKAKIPVIGPPGVATPGEYTSPDVWPLSGGAGVNYPALPYVLKKAGIKTAGIARADVDQAAGLGNLIQSSITGAGLKYTGTVLVPLAATDFTPYVQALKTQGPQATVQVLAIALATQMMNAAKTLAVPTKWANITINIDNPELKTLGPVANGMFLDSSFPPVSASKQFPGIKTFNQQMTTAGKHGVQGTGIRDVNALASWVSVQATADVAAGTSGTLTASKLLSALHSADKPINVEGLISWTPTAVGPKDFPRITISNVYLDKVVNQKVVLVSPKPINYFKVAGIS